MADITIEMLKQYSAMKAEQKQIEDQIRSLYLPITSIHYGDIVGGSSTPGDPTHNAVMRINELKQHLEELSNELSIKTREIEDWMQTLQDYELRAIIRAHYINGKTWAQTAKEVYGWADQDTPRKKVARYFE